ncbi:MAG: amidohydrolase family protein [Acidobacteria bacterium]|nr:amidohydrolase family protein [Acidobacteriota bacterium]
MTPARKQIAVVAAVVAAAGVAACGGGPTTPAVPADIAIVGARLIDGTGGEPIPDSVLLIRGDRVVAAGTRADTGLPAEAAVVDGAGKTVIPGLVDMHVHYLGDRATIDRQFRTQLYFGVTTARSIGADGPELVPLMLEAHAGRPDAPRVFTAGRGFTAPDGFNAALAQQPATEEEAREMVRELAAQRVHFVKMWVNAVPEPGDTISPEIRTAIVDESIANGLVPVAHIDDEADGRQLVEAGLRDFLHSTVLTFGPGAGAPVDDPEPSAEFIRMSVENGVAFTPTLSIIQNNWHFAERPELLENPELRAAFNADALARWEDPEARAEVVEAPEFEDRKAAFRQVQDFVKTMHDAGARVALGTDAGTPNVPMGWGVHHELELYVEAGLTPMQALVAATATGASLTPPVGEAEFGTLEVGKIADLVVLDADPLADIRNTLRIDRVMKAGAWVDREGLLPPAP